MTCGMEWGPSSGPSTCARRSHASSTWPPLWHSSACASSGRPSTPAGAADADVCAAPPHGCLARFAWRRSAAATCGLTRALMCGGAAKASIVERRRRLARRRLSAFGTFTRRWAGTGAVGGIQAHQQCWLGITGTGRASRALSAPLEGAPTPPHNIPALPLTQPGRCFPPRCCGAWARRWGRCRPTR